MINLENVSTYNLLYTLLTSANREQKDLLKALSLYNISDYKKLENFIIEHPIKNLNYDYLEKILEQIEVTIDKANTEGREINVYNISKTDNNMLEYTDKNVIGRQLILVNPVIGYNSTRHTLMEMDIKRIKYLLSHTTPNGDNALTYINRIGNSYAKKVYNAIKFYDDQIKRQLENYQDGVTNLFELNQDEKTDELILGGEPIQYCLEYIADTATEMIWGPLTDYQKNKLIEIAKKIKNGNYQDKTFCAIFSIIRDYVTLEETRKGLVKTKTINRFIVK